jgi:hypothetical protein
MSILRDWLGRLRSKSKLIADSSSLVVGRDIRNSTIQLGVDEQEIGNLIAASNLPITEKLAELTAEVARSKGIDVIDLSPCGELTFLVNDLGRPFSDAGIGNKFRDWCDQAELFHCSAHGVRKAGATIAAVNGATTKQLMAIFGWDSIKQAELYTRAAEQKQMAADAMHLIEAREPKA